MGDECEEVTMIMAAETARNRRYDDVTRRRPRQLGEDKQTQTDSDHVNQYAGSQSYQKERGTTLLSYMAFSLVIGTLCQFKVLLVSRDETNPYYIFIIVCLILTLVLQCAVACVLLYVSKREPVNTNIPMTLTLTNNLTALVASVTFINMAVFVLV